MTSNQGMNKAKSTANDEFYTQLSDIEQELIHYHKYFRNKVIYCNCDDYQTSNFVKYFKSNFDSLGLKRLVSTNYVDQQLDLFNGHTPVRPVRYQYDGLKTCVEPLTGDGDFRDSESIELLRRSDIIVTNPPFSLFRRYLDQLIKHQKQFLIIGHTNALKYKKIFPYVMRGDIWLGHRSIMGDTLFDIPPEYSKECVLNRKEGSTYKIVNGVVKGRVGGIGWFTNIGRYHNKSEIVLTKRYTPGNYPYYDNYNAINVDKVSDIPLDHTGLIGVPISFFDKYNQNQFEIIDLKSSPLIDKRKVFARIIIRNKRPVDCK